MQIEFRPLTDLRHCGLVDADLGGQTPGRPVVNGVAGVICTIFALGADQRVGAEIGHVEDASNGPMKTEHGSTDQTPHTDLCT